ncbi:uncharacterized [Lates japonicus]
MRQDLQSVKWSREDFSRDTLQHTHTSLCLYLRLSRPSHHLLPLLLSAFIFLSVSAFPTSISTPFLLFFYFCSFFPLFFHLCHFLYISLSPLYSNTLSLWIKLSLLWSLFFPLLCLYLPFGCRVCAVAERESDTDRERKERDTIPTSGQ